MALTSKEIEFCRIYASCLNSRVAAAKAGFAFPEKAGLKLLSKSGIAEEIERHSNTQQCFAQAADGLRKIAFGSVADAVRLVLHPDEIRDTDTLDLFMVSEIKLPKSGGVELKLFDRIKALEALATLSEGGDSDGAAPFINAIFKGTEAIGDIGRSSDDEL